MTTRYQIVIIGSENTLITEILDTLFRHIDDLGLKKDSIIVIDEGNFHNEYKANAPSLSVA
ncbi:MAG: hypothetical protein U5L72_13490 [Bacteroidales bacterium]|nr:hypothetical protein [Bacteroidales bacterium]